MSKTDEIFERIQKATTLDELSAISDSEDFKEMGAINRCLAQTEINIKAAFLRIDDLERRVGKLEVKSHHPTS